MDARSDGELMAAYARTGDEKVFAELVSRHQQAVYGACLRMLRNAHDAEDAAQAVFIILARKAAKLRREGLLNAWLHSVARNVARGAIRSRVRKERREDAYAADRERELDDRARDSAADPERLRGLLDEALGSLSPVLREAVMLRYLQGCSEKEAAARAGCPQGTLGRRAHDGLARLRTVLAKRGAAVSLPLLAAALESEAHAAPPATLLSSTLTAVHAYGAAGAATAAASSNAAAWAETALHTMFWGGVKSAAAAVAASVAIVGGGAMVVYEIAAGRWTEAPPRAAAVPARGGAPAEAMTGDTSPTGRAASVEERRVDTAAGDGAAPLPAEFRDALEGYFNAVENDQ